MLKKTILIAMSVSLLLSDTIFVSNEKDDTVSVIDSNTDKVIKTYEVGQRPRGILLTNDYLKLYICASDDDTVQAMDVKTGKILYNLPSGEDPEQFALSPDGKDLENGKIDAVAGLKTQIEFYLNFSKNKDKYYMTKGIDYVKSAWDLGVAVRTDFRALSYEIDGYMSELFRDGTIKKIFRKYNVSYEKPLAYQE